MTCESLLWGSWDYLDNDFWIANELSIINGLFCSNVTFKSLLKAILPFAKVVTCGGVYSIIWLETRQSASLKKNLPLTSNKKGFSLLQKALHSIRRWTDFLQVSNTLHNCKSKDISGA